jgi:hypothetical protein
VVAVSIARAILAYPLGVSLFIHQLAKVGGNAVPIVL